MAEVNAQVDGQQGFSRLPSADLSPERLAMLAERVPGTMRSEIEQARAVVVGLIRDTETVGRQVVAWWEQMEALFEPEWKEVDNGGTLLSAIGEHCGLGDVIGGLRVVEILVGHFTNDQLYPGDGDEQDKRWYDRCARRMHDAARGNRAEAGAA